MNITFLGTGTSQGVPMIGCGCEVCTSANPKDNRLRSAVWLQNEDTSVVIDSGPDFRYQMLRAKVETLDGIVFTHGHKDHVAGLDDVRAYNYWTQKDIDIFANPDTEEILRREFQYAFSNIQYPGLPQLAIHSLTGQDFTVGSMDFRTIKVLHYKLEVFGYRIGDFTYITDANYIAPEEMDKIRGTKILVLNALRHEKHISHFTLNEAIDIAQEIGAEQTYFTHISHQLGLHDEINTSLPQGIFLAYDGLKLTC
ncbi:MBL fold metallo-hydrolase [Edaphocola aurantiacus]|uniref:MBL fold metallo-hydrolase n=1 Tax=Edaphocola aurantiacus TaxID=2601682 RepID=UPI00293D527E|nr:MBL fold metallo-hydrolase [Edaphocola aurantiacus]